MNMYKPTLLLVFIFMLNACSGEEAVEAPTETPFAFVGNWLGTWSDNLFQGIPVSTKVRTIGTDSYQGDFFYNNNGNEPYTAAFGGTTDGRMTFETKGDSVLNFVFIQNTPDYKNGCPGTYKGSGAIDKNLNRLIISFTGDDCDGFHDDGKIIFKLD